MAITYHTDADLMTTDNDFTLASTSKESLTMDVTLGTAADFQVIVPWKGKLTRVDSIINGVLTTDDEVLTIENAAGDAAGTITITQSGSAAGDVDYLVPTTNNGWEANTILTCAAGGENGTATVAKLTFTFEV